MRVSLGLASIAVLVGCTGSPASSTPKSEIPAPACRWVALGDSYTRGEAARSEEAWPAVAAERLRARHRSVDLVANLGRTGWTSRDVLERQVPFLDEHPADLATVQVGINDLVQGRSEDGFREDLRALLAAVVSHVGASRVVAVTIPDFSVARLAPRFGDVERLHDAIARRNAIIVEESSRARVRVADVFARSRAAARDPSLLAADGIHPSARGYAAWVDDVLPQLDEIVTAFSAGSDARR